jgi:hypothetical protein
MLRDIIFTIVAVSSSCTDKKKLTFKVGKKKRNCKWVSKNPNSHCKKKVKKNRKKVALKKLCPEACDNCPNDNKNNVSDKNKNDDNGKDGSCCSLDYKNCVNYCGDSYNSCMSCNGDKLGWISANANESTCTKRWEGCNANKDCCDGLKCTEENGWSSCQPNSTTENDNTPTNPPTKAPVPKPTKSPTKSPESTPASPPTGSGGGGGDATRKSGKATFYGGNPSGGACGYKDLPQVTFPKGFSVAIGGDEFNDGYGCGACYEVTCIGAYGNNPTCGCGGSGKNKVVVQATDRCPECESTHFDLNTEAFTSIVAGQSTEMAGTCGIIETTFRRVSCDFKSNIKIRSKSGTSGYWYGLHIDDVAGYGAISKIQLREEGRRKQGKNSYDIVCDKSQGASFWICNRPNDRQIFAPLDVKLTDSSGRILTNNNVITNLSGNQEFDFRKNYGPISNVRRR